MTHSFPTLRSSDLNHLDRRLPLGEPGDRHRDLDLGEVLAQARDEDLAGQDDDGWDHLQVGDLLGRHQHDDERGDQELVRDGIEETSERRDLLHVTGEIAVEVVGDARSEEHTSELQSLMRISYAVFCLKKNIQKKSRDTIDVIIYKDTNKDKRMM